MSFPLPVIGLTGGIAAGKSTVARLFRREGCPVIDADALARLVLEPDGAAYGPVIRHFGTGILDEDRRIDRQRLGGLVFADPDARAALDRLTHPEIARLTRRAVELAHEHEARFVIYEAALLVETGFHRGLDGLIVVACPVELQLERLVARDGFTRQAAAARIAAQASLAEKLAAATWVIENDGDLVALEDRARAVLADLERRHPRET